MMTTRSLDHLVLSTQDLASARQRLTDLGFSVAPEARHPFGTCNACVYFDDSTYLEPLAIWNREKYDEAADAGNVFIRHDMEYRKSHGNEGLSALVVNSQDSRADSARFVAAGLSPGPNLSFARPFEMPDGELRTASFSLAFARDDRIPSVLAFACQRISMPGGDKPVRHTNGVTGISSVLAVAETPDDFVDLLSALGSANDMTIQSDNSRLQLANSRISTLGYQAMTDRYGVAPEGDARQPKLVGVVFRTDNLDAAEACLRKKSVRFAKVHGRVVVSPEVGQGAFMVLEAIRA